MGSPADGPVVGAPGASSAGVEPTVAEPSASHPLAAAGIWGSPSAARSVDRAGSHAAAPRMDGQCALQSPSPGGKAPPARLCRALSWTYTGALFALKTGSWKTR